MQYEYQVLESDYPGVPSEMLNEHGREGWSLCGIVLRNGSNHPGDPPPDEASQRWIFYFVRPIKSATQTGTWTGTPWSPETTTTTEVFQEGQVNKGGQNPPNKGSARPAAPQGSGGQSAQNQTDDVPNNSKML
jgi:hypothetical protein